MNSSMDITRDCDCRTWILESTCEEPVAFDGEVHMTTPTEKIKPLLRITIPDKTMKFLRNISTEGLKGYGKK
jgi:hypothetical protein